MNDPTLRFVIGLALGVLVVLAFRLIRARVAARYVARVYDEAGKVWVIGEITRTRSAALGSAWERAVKLGRQCSPPFDPEADGYTARVEKL